MALFATTVLIFIFAVYMGYRSWDKVKPGTRAFAVLLLSPHFLLILCFGINMSCGNEAVSVCFTREFQADIIGLFLLLPTLFGTAAALGIFLTAL